MGIWGQKEEQLPDKFVRWFGGIGVQSAVIDITTFIAKHPDYKLVTMTALTKQDIAAYFEKIKEE